MTKRVLMIAGPNGAGKTTAAMTLLPKFLGIHEFVNADEIARGLNPLNLEGQAIAAGKIMISRIENLTESGKSFGFESTGAGITHKDTLRRCKAAGYETALAFLWLPNAEMAVRRVKYRVQSGGHAIPEDTIRRRYNNGLKHLLIDYLPLVDRAVIYDNSQAGGMHLIAEKSPVHLQLDIRDNTIWKKITEAANA